MRFLSTTIVLVAVCCLAVAGHSHHGHDDSGHGGKHTEEVSYDVAHAHDHGGHGGGHDGGHDDGGHKDGGHDDGGHKDGGDKDGGDKDGGHKDGGHGHGHDDGHDHHAYPKYEFDYGVKDTKTGDIKSQKEQRDGHKVEGSYTLKEADGTTRHVEYASDKKKGFTATVHKIGHAHADHGSSHGHGHGHGDGHHDGHASSYVHIKKQEEKKH